MTDENQIKRRRYPRYKVDALVNVVGREALSCHNIQNISLGGICIKVPVVDKIGTQVALVINLPDGDTLTIEGVVAWVNHEPPMDMGIRYLNVDEPKLVKLKKLLALAQSQLEDK